MLFDLVAHAVKLREYGFAPIALHHPVLDDDGRVTGCNCVPYPAGNVCPPKNWGKHPVNPGWQRRTDLFLVPGEIQKEFGERFKPHDLNIGCATGPTSGLLIIDIDVGDDKPGLSELRKLEKRLGALPPTVVVVTGSGGLHYYLKYPAERDIRNSVCKLAAGIDIRATAGQAVLPPSLHKCGKRYDWAPGCGPEDVSIADIPPAWVELLLSKSGKQTTNAGPPLSKRTRGVPVVRSPNSQPPMNFDQARAVLAAILGHPLIEWAVQHPNAVSREVWRGIATNLAVPVLDHDELEYHARSAFHAISHDYDTYSELETDQTFDDALNSADTHGPITFGHMRDHGAPDEECKSQGGSSLVHAARIILFKR